MRIGLAVEVTFEERADGFYVPQFALMEEEP